MSKEKIIGIDLGTSNSAACVYDGEKYTMISSLEGQSMYGNTFPSYVSFTENGEVLVGEAAKKQATTNAKNTVSEIKRHMGEDYEIEILGEKYTPQDISSMILGKIKKDAERYFGEEIKEAVITVPANFNDNQKTATKDAAKIAGFKVKHLITEPTAASLAYGIDKKNTGKINILVFDMGGGTLDVTIMEYDGHNKFNVKSTSGDTHLGGLDMDNTIIKDIASKFEKDTGIDIKNNETASRRLREESERAKIELSNIIETDINLPFLDVDDEGNLQGLMTSINRSKLENLVQPIVNRCGKIIDDALSGANLNKNDIDKVILVGGPTKMPIVRKYVEDYLGKEIEGGINPMECVAQGAAIYGQIKVGGMEEVVNDVIPLSLGTKVKGGKTSVIIKRNSQFPIERTVTYSTVEDYQTAILVEIVQGEHVLAKDNTHLGSFLLDGIPPAKKGNSKIDVTFKIDNDGILNVTARDLKTNNIKSLVLDSPNKLPSNIIYEKIEEAKKRRKIENIIEKIIDVKNDADSVIYNANNLLSNPDVDESSITKIKSLIAEIQDEKDRLDNINFNEIEVNSISLTKIKLKIADLKNTLFEVSSSIY